MKKAVLILSQILVFLAVVEAAFFVRSRLGPSPVEADNHALPILVIGDSISLFSEPQPPYPARLEAILNQSAPGTYQVINLSQPAFRSTAALAALPEQLKKWKPVIVVTMLGKSEFMVDGDPDNFPQVQWFEQLRLYRLYALLKENLRSSWNDHRFRQNLSPDLMQKDFRAADLEDEHDDRVGAFENYQSSLRIWHELGEPEDGLPEATIASARLAGLAIHRPEAAAHLIQTKELLQRLGTRVLPANTRLRIFVSMGRAELFAGERTDAEADFRAAVESAPDRVDGYRELAWYYFSARDLLKCTASFERFLNFDPNNRQAINAYTSCYLDSGKILEGVKALEKLLPKSKEKALIWAQISSLHLRRGLARDAENDLANVQKFSPESREAYKSRLFFLRNTHRLDELNQVFRQMTLAMNEPSRRPVRESYPRIAQLVLDAGATFIAVQYPSDRIEILAELFKNFPQNSIQLVDGRQAFLRESDYRKRSIHEYFADDFEHLSGDGSQILAQALAEQVKSLKP